MPGRDDAIYSSSVGITAAFGDVPGHAGKEGHRPPVVAGQDGWCGWDKYSLDMFGPGFSCCFSCVTWRSFKTTIC